MTTHWRQQIKSTLTVVGLIALSLIIVCLWIAFKNGAFTYDKAKIYNSIRYKTHNNTGETIIIDGNRISSSNFVDPILSSNADILFEEFIKPSKIHVQPLHAEDLLYESQKFDYVSDTKEIVADHRNTGQFRNKTSRIWDPHPQYLLDAFGLHLHLVLYQDGSFIPKDMKITHISKNESFRERGDDKDREALQGCFYKGHVRGDEFSAVSVSLCNGMRGHIYTSTGSYFIQPVEDYTTENPNVLHKISRKQDSKNEEPKCDVCLDRECDDYFENKLPKEKQAYIKRRKRHAHISTVTDNNAYTIEVLVAVDKKMQEYHGENITAYILTLMSIVSSIYADASIGNSINVAVVHLLLLKDDFKVETNNVGVSASEMLSAFCKFIQKHQFHRDTALLLTRHQICRSANNLELMTKCDTLGLAELGTMCRQSSCAIVQDNGLAAAFTIAHELGHVLNMPHDDDTKCNQFRNPRQVQQNIMSRMLDHNTYPWSWSDCSRYYVTEYLENNHGTCMLNKPIHDMIEPTISNEERFAGENFSANIQCEFVFGPGSKICPYMPKCERLWCGGVEGCRTQHMPWADGTECDVNKWCLKGKCVPRNRTALVKVDGGWGSWSSYGTCSRTCGGGFQSSTRECNSPAPENGGKYCIRSRIRYRSCNTQSCWQDTLDFREKQCANYNKNNFGIPNISEDVQWVPKYGVLPAEECKLNCRVEKSNNYFVLSEKVIDGTSCTHDSFNKCVNGVCRQAGCDNELNSNATLDKCGVCNGNNNTCIDIHGSYSPKRIEESKKYSKTPYYYFVTRIPKGASNIVILQRGYQDDSNYIALSDDRGEYILNGYLVITQYPRVFPYGGITFEYTGTNTTVEKVSTSFARRLKRDLIVEILSRSDRYVHSELMEYSYTVSLNESSTIFHPYRENLTVHSMTVMYQWRMSNWSECDKLCEGKRFRTASCIHTSTDNKISLNYCQQPKPPDEYESCNTDCKLYWEVSRSECSHICGEGVRTLVYKCTKKLTGSNVSRVVDGANCPPTAKPLPSEKCIGSCKTATWSYDEWGPCSRTCGNGTKTRSAFCLSHLGGYIVDDQFCSPLQKESLAMPCKSDDCPVWSYGENTPCSVTCGEGIRSYAIYCKQNNHTVNRALCSYLPRLSEITKNCTMDPCHRKVVPSSIATLHADEVLPTTLDNNVYEEFNFSSSTTIPDNFRFKWRTDRWSSCSTTCGPGTKTRSVICVNAGSRSPVQVDNAYCVEEQPTNVAACEIRKCPQWSYSVWSECNTDCKRRRQVICRNENSEVDEAYCSGRKPASVEACCVFKWGYAWTACSNSCGIGIKKRQQVCKKLHSKSYSSPYSHRRGQVVPKSYCAHMREPVYYPKTKKCKQQCSVPKWEYSPWTKCSVGCGQGTSTRDVKCVLEKNVMNDTMCSTFPKPIKTRHCESKTDCRWRTSLWKNCSCTGYKKRKVTCYDARLNKLSTNCLEHERPEQKKKCIPPPNCSCRGIRLRLGKQTDGEYDLNIKSRKIRIYCYNMQTNNPLEYLTLKSDNRENYALYYDRRSRNTNQCPSSMEGEYNDRTIPSGMTHYSKIRLNLDTLQIIEDDFRFTRTSGQRPQSFGSAGDCYSITESCPQGRFSINLEGTKFRISPRTKWEIKGRNSTMSFKHKLEYPYQKVIATCGGYCGNCMPSKETTLKLEVL